MKSRVYLLVSFSVLFLLPPLSHSQPADSAWPMFMHDAKRTGRSPYQGPVFGILAWSFVTGDDIESSPSVGPGDTCYVVSDDDKLYALTSGGALLWSYMIGNDDYYRSSPAIGSDGSVYLGSKDNKFYALSSTGYLSWSFETGYDIDSSPVIESGGGIYVGSDDNRLYSFTSSGSLSWSYLTMVSAPVQGIYSSPTLGAGGRVYVGADDNRLYAFTSIGTLLWTYITGGYVQSSPTIGSDEYIYVGSLDARIYALGYYGSLSWSYHTGYYVSSSAAIGPGGRVHVGSWFGEFYVLYSAGSLLWSYSDFGKGNSPAVDSDGHVYVGGGAFSSTGILLWSYTSLYSGLSSSSIDSKGRLYAGSADNRLYVFEGPPTAIPTAGPPLTPTPTVTPFEPAVPTPTPFPEGLHVWLNQESYRPGDIFRVSVSFSDSRVTFDGYLVITGNMGVWSITGDRLKPGIYPIVRNVLIRNRFSSELFSTVVPPGGGGNYKIRAAIIPAGWKPTLENARDRFSQYDEVDFHVLT